MPAGGTRHAAGVDYVLLHGTAQSAAGWERPAAALANRGHRALPVDFPVEGGHIPHVSRPDLLAGILDRSGVK